MKILSGVTPSNNEMTNLKAPSAITGLKRKSTINSDSTGSRDNTKTINSSSSSSSLNNSESSSDVISTVVIVTNPHDTGCAWSSGFQPSKKQSSRGV
mmetsp:Transcript_23752/g.22860  ORF Transcript_23752/g.22860 Transcript_23752/m.22860 type:complete len:97 (+) Transcript_23752:819-1109(+)